MPFYPKVLNFWLNVSQFNHPKLWLSKTSSQCNHVAIILRTVSAMIAGLVSLTLGSNIIEQVTSTTEPMPLYEPNRNRYNNSSYLSRFYHFLLYCDPSLLLYGYDEHARCRGLLDNYLSLTTSPLPTKWSLREMSRNLWEAQRITYQEEDPSICRLSAYVTFTVPLCIAMMCSKSTLYLVISSLLHQSQNALITDYYYNSKSWNISTKSPGREMDSYVVSIGTTLGMIFALKKWLPETKLPRVYLPFTISLIASTLSVYVLASPQFSGLPIINKDQKGQQQIILSEEGGKYNVKMMVVSRALLQIPLFLIPPIAVKKLLLMIPSKKRPIMMIPLMTYTTILSYGLGFPAIMALNPSKTMIETSYNKHKGEKGYISNYNTVKGFLYNSCPMGMHIVPNGIHKDYIIRSSTTNKCPYS